jgi:hypothetical protein
VLGGGAGAGSELHQIKIFFLTEERRADGFDFFKNH